MLKQRGIVKKAKVISGKKKSEIWGKFLTQQGDNQFSDFLKLNLLEELGQKAYNQIKFELVIRVVIIISR